MKIPAFCIVPGLGRCKVLAYVGEGYFRVLTTRDCTYRIPRGRIQFLP